MKNLDEAYENLCLILYSIGKLKLEDDIKKKPKIEFGLHLIFDILSNIIVKLDPWVIEHIIIRYHNNDILKKGLGATGESLYRLTEEFVISNWHLFSDLFRHTYRHEIYEE